MKCIFPLSVCWALVAGAMGGAPEAEPTDGEAALMEGGTLPLDAPPTFADLGKASMKFRNPAQWPPRQVVRGSGFSQGDVSMAGMAGMLRLSRGEQVSPVLEVFRVSAGFRGGDLKEPGEFYPPVMPIQEETPVASLTLQGEVEKEAVGELLEGISEVLGIEMAKVRLWLDHELWKVTGPIEVGGGMPGGTTVLRVSSWNAGEVFHFEITMRWPGKDEVPGEERPRRRVRLSEPGEARGAGVPGD